MNYRYFLCAFLAACALCACGKTNPDKPTPDPPKDLPDVILSQDFTKGYQGPGGLYRAGQGQRRFQRKNLEV